MADRPSGYPPNPVPPRIRPPSKPAADAREAAEQRTHHILAAVARFDRDLASIGLGIDGFAGTINGQFEGGTFEISARAEGAPTYEPPTDLRDAIADAIDVERGEHVQEWPEDEQEFFRHGDWRNFTDCAKKLRELRHRKAADAVLPAVQAHVAAEVERARGAAERALALIAGTSCENSTSGPGACWRDYRDPNAKYGAERWCDPCIALAALTPDATDKLWQEHPGIDQHDEVATGGEQRG